MAILVFNPAIKDHTGSVNDNLGDCIIWQAVEQQLKSMFGPATQIDAISSHVPANALAVQKIRAAKYRFVGGTNLLNSKMRRDRQWKVSGKAMGFRYPAILMGVGWRSYEADPDTFTKILLKAVLSHKFLHSVRDGHTEMRLRSAGFENVINTSCPTLWELAGEPRVVNLQEPADRVLLMVTDYNRDLIYDAELVQLLAKHYREIIFWPQGSDDPYYGRYLLFGVRKQVRILDRSMEALEKFLTTEGPVDYVGTRLHGGIKCLKSGMRSLIIEVDNRATEIAKDTGLPTAARNDMNKVEKWIQSKQPCTIHIPRGPIDRWKGQFFEGENRQ